MTDINPDKILKQIQEGTIDPMVQLDLCRRRINNFRQSVRLDHVIGLCESEPLAAKINKVTLNIYAMLNFASLSDDVISDFLEKEIKDVYSDVFDYFRVPEETRQAVSENTNASLTTTVELNNFIHAVIAQNVERVNNLPAVVKLKEDMVARGLKRDDMQIYSSADIRERAVLYFADMPSIEKMRIISVTSINYGFLLTRLNDKQYAKKVEQHLIHARR